MGFTIDIDTGGTFTDGFFTRGDRAEAVKVPTTPHDLTECFLECIKSGAARFGVGAEDLLHETDIVRFSSTIGTNTIIQRDGSKLGLLVTAGKEGLAPTGTADGKPPLVLADMVLGISEEVSPSGETRRVVDQREVLSAAQELIDRGARCLVVAFANSDVSPDNERLARDVIKREYPRDYLGSVPVLVSSNVSPRTGESERINAAVINAYIHAKLVRLLYKAGEDLRRRLYRRSLLIGHNNGAVARVARTRAINTYNSGPAAGLSGAGLIGQLYGTANLITADMGGTSFDLGYIREGEASYALTPDIEGFPVNVPMLAINAIGAGGGSIASVKGGILTVGPQSAGALPGPVAFDLGGTEPTVTDADLVLGVLDPGYFLGGAMPLNADKARANLQERVAQPLGASVQEAALRIKRLVDENMGLQVKNVKQEAGLGLDPLMIVYGGAGPAHCCDIARVAGVRRIVVTPFSSVFSAFGSSTTDVGHLYYRRVQLPFEPASDFGPVAAAVTAMEREAKRDLRGEGFSLDEVVISLELLVAAAGADSEVKVTAEPDFHQSQAGIGRVLQRTREAFAAAGGAGADGFTVTAVSLRGSAPVLHYSISSHARASADAEEARKGLRPVFLEEARGEQEISVYEMERLQPGHAMGGPSLVESSNTTLLVQRGWRLTVDEYRNCVLEEVPSP